MGVEPTGDGGTRRPPVLKTGTITGPHALPLPTNQCHGSAGLRTVHPRRLGLIRGKFYSEPRHELPWLLRDSQVGLDGLESRELLKCFFVRDRARDDHVISRLPVHRGRDLVLRGKLHRVDNA